MYFGLLPNKIFVSECKGYNHEVSEKEVEIWLTEKLPVIRKWILDQPSLSDREIVFEYWSTGGFTEGARKVLKKRKNGTEKI